MIILFNFCFLHHSLLFSHDTGSTGRILTINNMNCLKKLSFVSSCWMSDQYTMGAVSDTREMVSTACKYHDRNRICCKVDGNHC